MNVRFRVAHSTWCDLSPLNRLDVVKSLTSINGEETANHETSTKIQHEEDWHLLVTGVIIPITGVIALITSWLPMLNTIDAFFVVVGLGSRLLSN